jgi:phosphatidylserine/phosphatidylglycerophosphate/cardiolipin synthase-like enzyme
MACFEPEWRQARNLLIVSTYFVPGERMMKQFMTCGPRNVRVRVLTTHADLNDADRRPRGLRQSTARLFGMGVDLCTKCAEQQGTFSAWRPPGGATGAGSTGSGTGGSRASHSKWW